MICRKVDSIITIKFIDGTEMDLFDTSKGGSVGFRGLVLSMKAFSRSEDGVLGNLDGSTVEFDIIDNEDIFNVGGEYNELLHKRVNVSVSTTYKKWNEDTHEYENVNKEFKEFVVTAWERENSYNSSNVISVYAENSLSRLKGKKLDVFNIMSKGDKDVVAIITESIREANKIGGEIVVGIVDNSIEEMITVFDGLSSNTLDGILSEVSQSTLSLIWEDADGKLNLLNLLDNAALISIGRVEEISGAENVFVYDVSSYNEIDRAGGIKLSDISLQSLEVSSEDNLDTGGKVYVGKSVVYPNYIITQGEKVNSFSMGRQGISIQTDNKTQARVKFLEVKNTTEDSEFGSSENGIMVDKENNLLINKEAAKVESRRLEIMRYNNRSLSIEGYIRPDISVGDKVKFIGSKLGINADYFVVSVELDLNAAYRCKLGLVKYV